MLNHRTWGIRKRLILLLLATLLPLSGLGIQWALTAIQEEHSRLEHEARELAALVAAHVKGGLAVVHEMLEVSAQIPALRDLDGRAADRLFQGLLATSPHLDSLVLLNAAGAAMTGATPRLPGKTASVESADWFRAALRSGQPAVSGFQASPLSGEPVAVLANPVLNREGRIHGAVAAALRLASLRRDLVLDQADMNFIRVPVTWAVVDGQGLILLHSDPGATAGTHIGALPGILRVEAPVAGTAWRAILDLPEALATARARQPLLTIGLPAGLILIGSAGVAFWIARSTWRPLQALGAAVRRIAAGEAPSSEGRHEGFPVEAVGEVGEVARAFIEALDTLIRRQRELTALLTANQAISSSLELHEILRAVAGQAAAISGVPVARVFLQDHETQTLRCRVVVGAPPDAEQEGAVPVSEGLLGEVARSGQAVAVADCREDSRTRASDHLGNLGLVSFLGLPVRFQDTFHGVLAFNTFAPRAYTPKEFTFLGSFANQAALAIQNACLYEAIRQHAASLEERVRERTRDLEEARRQAEGASRFKSEFLANISHEFGTPLDSIIGLSEMLLAGEAGRLTEAQAQHVADISRAGGHLKELISNVLVLTKVEWGKLTLRLKPLQVADILKDTVAIVRAPASKKGQELHIDVPVFLPPLRADPVRLRQICYNLLSNAVKFTPRGGQISLTVRVVDQPSIEPPTPPVPAEGPFLELRVRDTGIGIRAEDLPRLFHEFVQLGDAATEREEGTGLGLALTKRLVELHGGRIWAESAGEGQGSTFTVLLPLGGWASSRRAGA